MHRDPKEIRHIKRQRRNNSQYVHACNDIRDDHQITHRRCRNRNATGYLRKRHINPLYDPLAFYEPEVKLERRDYKIKRDGHDHWSTE